MSVLAAVAGAAVGAVVAGAMAHYSAKEQAKSQKEMMEEQNMMNMENYAKRYQLTTEDMRKAGLNPILAASGGFSVGNAPTVQTHAPDLSAIGSNMSAFANSAKAFAEADKTDTETEKVKVEIDQVKAATETSLAEAAYKRGLTLLTEEQVKKTAVETQVAGFQGMQYSSQAQKNYAEIGLIGAKKQYTEQQTKTSRAQEQDLIQNVQVNMAKVDNLVNDTLLLKQKTELTQAENRNIDQTLKILEGQAQHMERLGEVYSSPAGGLLKWIQVIREAIGIQGSITAVPGLKSKPRLKIR